MPVGTTVTFSETSDVEIHTFSFGPAAYLATLSNALVTPIPAAAGPADARSSTRKTYFPSDIPGERPAVLQRHQPRQRLPEHRLPRRQPRRPTQPSSFKVTFTKAGTYNFQCLIHPFMKGQIVVG